MNLFAILALLPVMIGPLAGGEQGAIVAQLCNGGTITIPLDKGKDRPDEPCFAKGCHAGTCRKSLIERNAEGDEDGD